MSTPALDLGRAATLDQATPRGSTTQDNVDGSATASETREEPASTQASESRSPREPNGNPPGASGSPGEQLILRRDLNEALLLMDFISGRPDVHIWDIGDIKYPVREQTALRANNANGVVDQTPTLPPIEVIRRICALRYPPEGNQSIQDRADDSALLLCVKDKLNSVAHPANGLTIAYTYMFLEETAREQPEESTERQAESIIKKGTRATVAKEAYPGLISSAKRFRCFHRNVARVGAAITIFSAMLLWLVVYGVQLTSRFEEDQKRVTEETSQIYAIVDKENAALAAASQTHDSVPARCDGDLAKQSNQIRMLCNQWSYYQARYDKSINDVAAFANKWPSAWLMIPFPTAPTLQQNRAGDVVARQEDVQSITLVLSACASYVLPVLFGLVGTIASFLRDISNRITGSILSPRDETLAIIRLILGAIAGLAVGLFFTPSTTAAQISAGAGVLTLSASGIAFLAGYGADGFFRLMDALITRLFSLDQKPSPTK
jgi:hypothetical protein